MNLPLTTIAMEGQRWSTIDNQESENQVHQSVMASQVVSFDNLRPLSPRPAPSRSRETPLISLCTIVGMEARARRWSARNMEFKTLLIKSFVPFFYKISQIDLGPRKWSWPTDSFSADRINGPVAHEETTQQPNKERPNCVIHVSDPVQRSSQLQLSCYITLGESTMSLLENLPCHSKECTQGSETKKTKIVRGDRLDYQRTLVDSILNVLVNGGEPLLRSSWKTDPLNSRPLHSHTLIHYLRYDCTRSSNDPLNELDPEIELTLRRLRKDRNIVVSNSSNSDSVSSSDNNNSTTNSSDSIEYNSTNIFAESGQMKNNDRILKELATPDVVYQPWCIQRRPPQTFERIPCGLFHNEATVDTRRLHQDEGIPILLGWSSKGLVVSSACSLQHLERHEMHILGEVLFGIQNCDHQEGNLWDKEIIRRNSA
ncbi:hypothetical protein CR513_28871, partial [Mucuna pruriens]